MLARVAASASGFDEARRFSRSRGNLITLVRLNCARKQPSVSRSKLASDKIWGRKQGQTGLKRIKCICYIIMKFKE